MKMLVGLGNPGKKYSKTRHNTGFILLDELVAAKNLTWGSESKFKSDVCVSDNVIYIKPQTFMNNSGHTVSLVKEYYGISFEDICVIHDDVDLALGQTKLQTGAGHAGHKGVISIIESLGTKDFMRLRVGIGRPSEESDVPVDDYVLSDLTPEELDSIKKSGAPLLENLNFH